MNIDIRIKNNFFRHPKTKKLESELGKSAPLFLIKIWIFASEFYPDGVLKNVDDKFIENEVGWPENSDKSLIQTLENIGFIERYKGNIIIHDWQEHNSYASENNNRADKGRFSKLKQSLPIVANYMQSIGIISISKEYYQKISNAKNPLDTAKILFKNSRNDKEEITGQNNQGDPLGTLKSDPLGTPRVNFSSNTNTNTNTKSKTISKTISNNSFPPTPQGKNESEKKSDVENDLISEIPDMEFVQLRNFYDENARPEGSEAGFVEFKKLKSLARYGKYPGIFILMDDIKKRIDGEFWDKNYIPGLAKYLNERTWEQKVTTRERDNKKTFAEIEEEREKARKERILEKLRIMQENSNKEE